MDRQRIFSYLATMILAAVFGLGIYSRSLSGPYLFDDLPAYGGDFDQVSFPPPSNWLHPETRPVTQVWHSSIRQLSDTPVKAYRLAGVLLHVVNVGLMFLLVRRVSVQALERCSDGGLLGMPADLFAGGVAAIWLVHPVCVQAVCSIIQQAELLMTTFFICYLLIIAYQIEAPSWFAAGLLYGCLIAGLYAKVVMVAAVPVGMLLSALLSNQSVMSAVKSHWRFHIAPLLGGVLVAGSLLPLLLRAETGVGFGGDSPPVYVYLLSNLRSICAYFGLAVWPASLSIDRNPHFITNIREASPFAFGVLVYLVLAWFAWKNRHPVAPANRLLGFLMLTPVLILAPTSSFIPTADVMFEHRFYLPLAFVIWASGLCFLCLLLPRITGLRYSPKLFVPLVGLLIGGLACRSWVRAADYASAEKVWREALIVDPANARGAQNFVATLQRQERDREIADEIIKLMVIADSRGGNVEALAHQLAKDYLRNAKADKALPILAEVVSRSQPFESLITDRQRREFGEKWFDMAIACTILNRPKEGINAILQTLRVSPTDPFAHALAADLYEAVGEQTLASQHRKASEELAKNSVNLAKPVR
jgi:tetratricopeptide (TPR) repeat protein